MRQPTWAGVLLAVALGHGCRDANSGRGHTDTVTTPSAASPSAGGSRGKKAPDTEPVTAMHPVYSLIDNEPLAHRMYGEGLLLVGGSPGFAKYMGILRPRSTWQLNRGLDGRRVALARAGNAHLLIPLTGSQARNARTLTLHVKSPKPQGLRLLIGGKDASRVALAEGWQTVELALPAGRLQPGENQLTLRWARRGEVAGTRAYAALAWAHIGARPPSNEAIVQAIQETSALWVAGGAGYAFYLLPHHRAALRFEAQATGACTLAISARGLRETVTLKRANLQSATKRGQVDLAPIAGQVTRTEVTAEGANCQGIRFSTLSVEMPGKRRPAKPGRRPKHIVFWLIDNLRSDHLPLYDKSSRVQTPTLSKLGHTGVVFENAYIAGTESRVSHASLWTGMYPRQHRFIGPKVKLNQELKTLAEVMQETGFRTAAWVANGNISKFWGFAQGWNSFRNTLHKGGGLTAERLADHAIAFVKKRGTEPFYLYLGTIDAHVSWRGRQPWLRQYDPGPYSGRFRTNVMGPTWDKIALNPGRVSQRDRQRVLAIYDSTISYNDHHLGRLIDALEKAGIRDDTMIVVTADHGEEFWEFGKVGHGGSLRDTVVHVPLIIHYPPLFGSGIRISDSVEAASIMPTVIEAVGGRIPDSVQTAPLLKLTQAGGAGYPQAALATQYELAHAIRIGHFKLRVGGRLLLKVFDLRKGERQNIAKDHPLATRLLMDALGIFLTYQPQWRHSRWGNPANLAQAFGEDMRSGKGPAPVR